MALIDYRNATPSLLPPSATTLDLSEIVHRFQVRQQYAGLTTDHSAARGTHTTRRSGVLSFDTMNRIYDTNGLVRAVVDTKVRQMVGLDWDVTVRKEKRFVAPALLDLVRDLFRKANLNGEDWTVLMTKMLHDLYVLDAGVIEKVRNPMGRPVELVALDGSTISPAVDDHLRITGYTQEVKDATGTKRVVEFAPEDLVYMMANPTTQRVWGHSPLESIVVEVGADIYAMNHNAMNFTDGVLADNILVLGKIGKMALEQTRAFFDVNKGRGHLLPIVSDLDDPQGAKLLNLRQTNRDMEFIQFEQWLFQRVCAAYQVEPSQVIMLQPLATKATSETQDDIHKSKSLGPEMAIIAAKFTEEVCAEFHDQMQFEFVQSAKLDDKSAAEVWGLRLRAGVPLNQLREENGEEPLLTPTVVLDGEKVPLFDLPMNPDTGTLLGDAYLNVAGAGVVTQDPPGGPLPPWAGPNFKPAPPPGNSPGGAPKAPPPPAPEAAGAPPWAGADWGKKSLAKRTRVGSHHVASGNHERWFRQEQTVLRVRLGHVFEDLKTQGLALLDDAWHRKPAYAPADAEGAKARHLHLPKWRRSHDYERDRERLLVTTKRLPVELLEWIERWMESTTAGLDEMIHEQGRLLESIERVLGQQGAKTSASFGVSFTNDMYNKLTADYANYSAYERGTLVPITDTVRTVLGNRLQAGVESRFEFEVVRRDIADLFDGLRSWETMRIARTELSRAARSGTIGTVQNLHDTIGLPMPSKAILIPTASACDLCLEAVDEVEALERPTLDEVEAIADDLHPNCQCAVGFDWDDESVFTGLE